MVAVKDQKRYQLCSLLLRYIGMCMGLSCTRPRKSKACEHIETPRRRLTLQYHALQILDISQGVSDPLQSIQTCFQAFQYHPLAKYGVHVVMLHDLLCSMDLGDHETRRTLRRVLVIHRVWLPLFKDVDCFDNGCFRLLKGEMWGTACT